MSDIRDELGLTGSFKLSDAEAVTLNDCASGGSPTAPHTMDEWAGYNHDAGPAKPTGLSGNPGSVNGGQGDATQDSHVFAKVSAITCAASYDLLIASTEFGTYSEVDSDPGPSFAYNVGAAETTKWAKIRGVSNTSKDGTLSDALELKTAPTAPKSPSSSDDVDCADLTITFSWSNGSSPSVRDSKVEYRTRFKPSGGSWGSWSSWSLTAFGASSFDHNVGAVSDGDQVQAEMYYDEESSTTSVTRTHTITCPI